MSAPAPLNASPADVVLAISALTKSFLDPKHPAVNAFDLRVYRGEVLALLGPSGCGKTTLMRLIAGFERPDAGSVVISGQVVAGEGAWVKPEHRKVGFVFQDYALFPHLNVLQNVAFGLHILPKRDRLERAREVIDLVGLTIFNRRFPHQLSGGQQQRVALARALAPAPELILLDEPFSNLDAALRGSTRTEVRRILKRTNTTALLVTHDQEEAMTFADRLAVMRAGKLEQIDRPERVYMRPRTAFVADFLGSTNLLWGEAKGNCAETLLGKLSLSEASQGSTLLSVRPEDLSFDSEQGLPVKVIQRDFKGHDLTFCCETLGDSEEQERFVVQTDALSTVQMGDVVGLKVRGVAVPLQGSSRP